MNDQNSRIVVFSPLKTFQYTNYQIELVNSWLLAQGREVVELMFIHDLDTEALLNENEKDVRLRFSNIKSISRHMIPPLNKINEVEITMPFNHGDCFIVSGTGAHRAFIFHTIATDFNLLNKDIFMLHPLPNADSMIVYKFRRESDGVKIRQVNLLYPEKNQSLKNLLVESQTRFVAVEPGNRIPKEIKALIGFENKGSMDDFKENVMRVYNLNHPSEIGFKCEEFATKILAANSSMFEEIYLNVEFLDYRGKGLIRQEEDIIAMKKNGDLLWISCKFSRDSQVIAKELKRLETDLPIPFPQKRIQRIVLTYSEIQRRRAQTDSDSRVKCANLSNLLDTIDME